MQAAEKKAISLDLSDVNRLAADDMAAVDRLIRVSLASDVALVSQVSEPRIPLPPAKSCN